MTEGCSLPLSWMAGKKGGELRNLDLLTSPKPAFCNLTTFRQVQRQIPSHLALPFKKNLVSVSLCARKIVYVCQRERVSCKLQPWCEAGAGAEQWTTSGEQMRGVCHFVHKRAFTLKEYNDERPLLKAIPLERWEAIYSFSFSFFPLLLPGY